MVYVNSPAFSSWLPEQEASHLGLSLWPLPLPYYMTQIILYISMYILYPKLIHSSSLLLSAQIVITCQLASLSPAPDLSPSVSQCQQPPGALAWYHTPVMAPIAWKKSKSIQDPEHSDLTILASSLLKSRVKGPG